MAHAGLRPASKSFLFTILSQDGSPLSGLTVLGIILPPSCVAASLAVKWPPTSQAPPACGRAGGTCQDVHWAAAQRTSRQVGNGGAILGFFPRRNAVFFKGDGGNGGDTSGDEGRGSGGPQRLPRSDAAGRKKENKEYRKQKDAKGNRNNNQNPGPDKHHKSIQHHETQKHLQKKNNRTKRTDHRKVKNERTKTKYSLEDKHHHPKEKESRERSQKNYKDHRMTKETPLVIEQNIS